MNKAWHKNHPIPAKATLDQRRRWHQQHVKACNCRSMPRSISDDIRNGENRRLSDLSGIGPAMLKDFEMLGIHSVTQLSKADPEKLYDRLCRLTHSRQDPCVLDTFTCAVAQARDPHLPRNQCNWWYWSRKRKNET